MFSFVLSCATSLIFLAIVLRSKLDQERGSMTVTRVVRDTVMNRVQSVAIWLSLLCGIIFTVTSSAGENQWWSGVPNFVVVVIAFIFQCQSNKSKQRVDNTRTIATAGAEMVDGSLEVAGNVAGAIGGAVLPGISAKEGQEALGSVFDAVGDMIASGTRSMEEYNNVAITSKEITDKVDMDAVAKAGVAVAKAKMGAKNAVKSMTTEVIDRKDESTDAAALLEDKGFTTEEFIRLAEKAGADVNDKSVEQIADELYHYIPNTYKDIHKDMSVIDVVCYFLKGRS